MTYSFHEEAEKELFLTVDYYEKLQKGLGLRFSKQVSDAIKIICEFPLAFPKIDLKTRRCLVNKFPFGILYQTNEENIRIIAVMHLHRKPGYWKNR
jgi:plasmid stabilization system protein ParE